MLQRQSLRSRPYAPITLIAYLMLMASGCGTTGTSSGYNATTNPNQLNEAIVAEKPMKNVVIAHVNIGAPSRNYIKRSEAMVDGRIAEYLRDNGYNILPQREFSQRWNNATLIYGDPVDPTTGRINTKTFIRITQSIRDDMRDKTDVDGFIFTDLIEHDAVVSGGMNHIARFNGVSRKPSLKGPGDGVSSDFDWSRPVSAVSLQISVYNIDLDQAFAGLGGIDLTDAIDTRSGNGWVRRKDILENENYIDQGIELALHPLIVMDNWPGADPSKSN
ncbi:MAG: hypothetical protein HOH17_10020 [Halieaceae bacterium]|nr:hypothetical protein [Halieaceae bacterium]